MISEIRRMVREIGMATNARFLAYAGECWPAERKKYLKGMGKNEN